MQQLTTSHPIDYLLIGHITQDLTTEGPRLGGGVTYSALTAQAIGLRVGIVTSFAEEISLAPMNNVPIVNIHADASTTFENISTESGRVQYIYDTATNLHLYHVPDQWRTASIVHLAPVAQEVEPSLVRNFPSALIGVTPQGWLRSWGRKRKVIYTEWPESAFVLQRVGAAVISAEDVHNDESRIEEFAAHCRVLAITEGKEGTRLYWNGDVRRFRPPKVAEIDSTGAGDIFAAAFFSRLFTTRDPWEAARFATILGAISVTRPGLDAIPNHQEIEECMVEVL